LFSLMTGIGPLQSVIVRVGRYLRATPLQRLPSDAQRRRPYPVHEHREGSGGQMRAGSVRASGSVSARRTSRMAPSRYLRRSRRDLRRSSSRSTRQGGGCPADDGANELRDGEEPSAADDARRGGVRSPEQVRQSGVGPEPCMRAAGAEHDCHVRPEVVRRLKLIVEHGSQLKCPLGLSPHGPTADAPGVPRDRHAAVLTAERRLGGLIGGGKAHRRPV